MSGQKSVFFFSDSLLLKCHLTWEYVERTATMEEHKTLDKYFDTAFRTKECTVCCPEFVLLHDNECAGADLQVPALD